MSENYNSPEQQYRDQIAAGNLLTRIGIFGSSELDLKQIVANMDPALLSESEAAIAGYAQQQDHRAIADAALANSLTTDTLSADGPATEIPDSPEELASSEESMLTETSEDPAPWLAEEPPIWGSEE